MSLASAFAWQAIGKGLSSLPNTLEQYQQLADQAALRKAMQGAFTDPSQPTGPTPTAPAGPAPMSLSSLTPNVSFGEATPAPMGLGGVTFGPGATGGATPSPTPSGPSFAPPAGAPPAAGAPPPIAGPAPAPRGPLDGMDIAAQRLLAMGRPDLAAPYLKAATEQRKAAADTLNTNLEAQGKAIAQAAKLAGSVQDAPDPAAAYARILPQLRTILPPQLASQVPMTYSAEWVTQALKLADTADDTIKRHQQAIADAKAALDQKYGSPEAFTGWTKAVANGLAASTDAQSYRANYQIANSQTVPLNVRQQVMAQFADPTTLTDPASLQAAIRKADALSGEKPVAVSPGSTLVGGVSGQTFAAGGAALPEPGQRLLNGKPIDVQIFKTPTGIVIKDASGKDITNDPGLAPYQAPPVSVEMGEKFTEKKEAITAIEKAENAFDDAHRQAQELRQTVDMAKGGNLEAANVQNLKALLSIVTSAGIKRINQTELNTIGSAGSFVDRIQNAIGKVTQGKPLDPKLQGDLQEYANMMERAAYREYADKATQASKDWNYDLAARGGLRPAPPGTFSATIAGHMVSAPSQAALDAILKDAKAKGLTIGG